jgi:hypothetical protein
MHFLVCLSSEDDAQALQERSRQVALMDEIYVKATQVNVHLGSGNEKSDVAIKAVKSLMVAYLPAMLAKMSGVGQEVTRRRYEEVADEVLGESFVHNSYLLCTNLHCVRLVSMKPDIFCVLCVQLYEHLFPTKLCPMPQGLL